MSFTVIPAPTITGLSPTSGAVGTTVTISGTNSGRAGSSTVTFRRHAGNDIFGLECDQHRGGGADRRQHGECGRDRIGRTQQWHELHGDSGADDHGPVADERSGGHAE